MGDRDITLGRFLRWRRAVVEARQDVSENTANSDTNDSETSFSDLFSRICHYLYSGL